MWLFFWSFILKEIKFCCRNQIVKINQTTATPKTICLTAKNRLERRKIVCVCRKITTQKRKRVPGWTYILFGLARLRFTFDMLCYTCVWFYTEFFSDTKNCSAQSFGHLFLKQTISIGLLFFVVPYWHSYVKSVSMPSRWIGLNGFKIRTLKSINFN